MNITNSVLHKVLHNVIQNQYYFDKLVVHHIELLKTNQAIVSIEVQHNNKIHFRNVFFDENTNFEIYI